jgi:hypothetical protein
VPPSKSTGVLAERDDKNKEMKDPFGHIFSVNAPEKPTVAKATPAR